VLGVEVEERGTGALLVGASVAAAVLHGPRTMHTRIFFFEFTQTGSDETVNIYLISGETFQKSR